MTARYYTHFVAAEPVVSTADEGESCEWSGVVELMHPLQQATGQRQLRSLLAHSFDLAREDIHILSWARLH